MAKTTRVGDASAYVEVTEDGRAARVPAMVLVDPATGEPQAAGLMSAGGNLAAQTAATGTNWTAFAGQECRRLTLANNAGTTVEFRQGGAGAAVPVFAGSYFVIEGVTNANQIAVKRTDSSNTQVTVAARWES